jgi:hypothetical protein
MYCVQRGAQMANGLLVLIEKVLKTLSNSTSCMQLHAYPAHCKFVKTLAIVLHACSYMHIHTLYTVSADRKGIKNTIK